MEITPLFPIVLPCSWPYDSLLTQDGSFPINPYGQPCYTIANNVMFSVRAKRKVSMEAFDLGRRTRDFIIPNIRKKYHITGQYLSLAAAAEVIQVVRLGLLAAGCGELTEEQLAELGTVLEPEVHQQLRPKSGGKKAVVLEIERLWSDRSAAHAPPGVPQRKASVRAIKVAILSLLGMLLGVGLATLFFHSRGMIRQEVGKDAWESAIFAKATRDVIANRLAEVQAKVAGHHCPGKPWEDDQKEVLASQYALVKATERAEYERGRLEGLAHPKPVQVPEPMSYHIKRVTGIVAKLVQDQKSLLPKGAVDQARAELLRAAVQQGRACK
jgi:hypothetical protein